eukprot:10884_1
MYETDAKTTDDDDGNESQQSMLLMLAKHNMFFECPNKVPEYLNILMDSQHQYLNDTSFVRLLIEYGLIKGIKHHLQQNKDKREDVMLSSAFITHLLQKQPQFTEQIMDSCARDIVHLVEMHSTDSDVLHSLCDTIHTSICLDPDTALSFQQNELESVLPKIDEGTNDLLFVLKEQDEIMNELSLINTMALESMDNPHNIDLVTELKDKIQSVLIHMRSATNTPIRRNNRLVLMSEFDQLESYLNASHLSILVWAKGLIRQMMNVAQYPRLKQIAITVHNVGKGSICIDYTLETYDIQLLDLAERNLHSADKNIAFPSENTESIKTDIDANNPQQPNEEVSSPHIGSATFIKQAYQPFVNLYKTPHGAEFAVDAGTIQFALQQMSDNPHANDCCVYAAKIIGALAAECPAKSAKRLLSNDDGNGSGLSIISNTLRALHSDPNISAALIKLMDILCGLNSESIHALIDAGAVQSVLNVLIMFNSGSSLMHVLLLIVCMELLIKFTRSDSKVLDSIQQNGAMKSIGCIALAMDNNVESSPLITVGRRALTAFVREEDVHEAMNIIARSQSEPDSFDRNMLHYAISIVGNTEFVGYTEYIVSRKAIPLLLSIMSSDIADAAFLASTIHALGRLLTTSDTIAMFESENGMQRLDDVVNHMQYSELIMYRMCDTVRRILNTKHEVQNHELMRSITKRFKSHGEDTMWMPRYYVMLSDVLDDHHFVALLIGAGLMDGIRSHLKHNKDRSEDVDHIIPCVTFITHLQSKQPKTTKDIMNCCGQDIVDLIEMHATNTSALKALYETIHTSIFNDPHAVASFKPYGLEDVLHKILKSDDNHETHHLLSVLKTQEELLSDLNSIKAIALRLTQNPSDIDLRKQLQIKVQFVMAHMDRASLIKPVHQSFVHLYKTKHGAELVADSGIIQLAIQHMSENPYANDCTIYAAKIIGALATKCPAKCENILLSGASTIATALNQFQDDPDIAAALTQTVNILCGLNSKFIQGFIDAGTVQDVLDILNIFNSGDSLLDLLILIACTELLIQFAQSDNSVRDSIKEKGAMKRITLAMTNHPDSSKLVTAGRKAIKLFVQEEDLSQAMDIIAQSRGDHNINVLQHAISMVSNMELNAANIEKILLEREGLTEKRGIIPHLLSIIDEHLRPDEPNIEGLFSTVHALSRLLIASDAIATYVWQEHDGINIFETIVVKAVFANKVAHSEVVMIAVCEAIRNIVNTTDGADIIKEESNLLPLITKNVLKSNGDYT